jgi:mRNA interferase RelE/StbE
MNKITWSTKAVKQLRKLNKPDQITIWDAVDDLSGMPNSRNVKALTKHEHQYRLRIGNYRVFFDFDGALRIVQIEEVKKRDERTY